MVSLSPKVKSQYVRVCVCVCEFVCIMLSADDERGGGKATPVFHWHSDMERSRQGSDEAMEEEDSSSHRLFCVAACVYAVISSEPYTSVIGHFTCL